MKQIITIQENVKAIPLVEHIQRIDAKGVHDLPAGTCLYITDSEGHEVFVSLSAKQAKRLGRALLRSCSNSQTPRG